MVACAYMKRSLIDPFPTDTPTSYPTAAHRELFEAILSLKNTQEAANFFRDLLTTAEINEFANRWQIVKLLTQRKSYLTIAQKLNVSTTTVTRVAHWLQNGMGGYRTVVDRLLPQKFKDAHIPSSHYQSGKGRGLKNPRVL
jgi:TrpR-related protein YerC/YecD